jgi:catechol 2,3-dioxygenase-like lactoylglutathione lyase family enzyme
LKRRFEKPERPPSPLHREDGMSYRVPAIRGRSTVSSKEPEMSNAEMRRKPAANAVRAGTIDMKLEVVVIPVLDVDRAKRFYSDLGWRLDIDYTAHDDFRVIQFTPPGSGCSVIFGKNVSAAAPGSAKGLHLIVSDIQAARDELLRRGIEISELFHDTGGIFHHVNTERLACGPNPQRKSYASYASFSDPDGNGWVFQEVTARLTGRIEADDTSFTPELTDVVRRATGG